jgi:hypothetical protein
MVATAIAMGVLVAGFNAYTYFTQKTQVELSKLDETQQFGLLTKDFLKFSEGAGLSTVYLNLPISIKNCVDDSKPCLRKLGTNESFISPGAGDGATFPEFKGLKDKSCVQFFRDSHGDLKFSSAYNLSGGMAEQVNRFQNYNLQETNSDYYLTWPMRDANSVPFILMKVRDVNQYFKLMADHTLFQYDHAAFEAKKDFRKAFFESNVSPEQAKDFIGYPFLIYGGKYQNQFGVYVAKDITFCDGSPNTCKSGLGELIGSTDAVDAARFVLPLGSTDPEQSPNVYMITLDKIDFAQDRFFAETVEGVKASLGDQAEDCFKPWAATSGADAQYLFPSGRLSVFNAPADSSAAVTSDGFYNPMQYNKHASIEANTQEMGAAPYMFMIPIDIVRYTVRANKTTKEQGMTYALMSELWHMTEKKESMKVTNISGDKPFYFTRKLGSPEISLWYSFKR